MKSRETILVTGGAGYIGAHTSVELLGAGYDVVIIDNLVNSKKEAIRRIEQIAGRPVHFFEGDVRDTALLNRVFDTHTITGAIHFAALKAVGESVRKPLAYYRNNVEGLLAVLEIMQQRDVKQFVFSSSATVYGDPHTVPITEDFPLSATNPYGQSKLIAEQVLRDLLLADPSWRIATLRYFNPVGAHASGLIGEDPQGIPNNLMPYIAQVAVGRLARLQVFGGDYPTSDGTGVRDFIHVVDLARGHLAALAKLGNAELNGEANAASLPQASNASFTVNLGTGQGYSVLELVKAFEKASGKAVPYDIVARRPGDIAACYADASAAHALLDWKAEYGLDEICADSWRWQSQNPEGYIENDKNLETAA